MRSSVLTVLVVLLQCAAIVLSSQCTTFPSQNITQPNIVAPRFMVTAADCCAACGSTNGCIAAVFSNFYCSMKASLDGMEVTTGSQVLFPIAPPQPTEAPNSTLAPPPTNATTSAPTPSTTTVVPTPVPTQAPPVTVIREVTCEYSSHCNQSNDNSCATAVYFNNTCQKKHKRICGDYHIHVQHYDNDGCGGVVVDTVNEDMNTCEAVDYTYYGHFCDVQKAPATGIAVLRTDCNDGCDESDCNRRSFTTGVCHPNPFSWLTGSSVLAWCFPEYVVWSGYGSVDCTGPAEQNIGEPLGCWETGYNFIHNICG